MFILSITIMLVASICATQIIVADYYQSTNTGGYAFKVCVVMICAVVLIAGLGVLLGKNSVAKGYVVDEVLHDYTSGRIQTEINVTYLNNNISKADTIYYYK